MRLWCIREGCERPVENQDTGLCATHNREERKAVNAVDKFVKRMKKSLVNDFNKKAIEKLDRRSNNPKGVKKQSNNMKQLMIEYFDACAKIAAERPAICEACGRPQGGVIQLSNSHLISRDYCHKYNRLDLYVDPNNIKLHCRDWMGHIGCHTKWESNRLRPSLPTYKRDMAYIAMEIPELYRLMRMNEEGLNK